MLLGTRGHASKRALAATRQCKGTRGHAAPCSSFLLGVPPWLLVVPPCRPPRVGLLQPVHWTRCFFTAFQSAMLLVDLLPAPHRSAVLLTCYSIQFCIILCAKGSVRRAAHASEWCILITLGCGIRRTWWDAEILLSRTNFVICFRIKPRNINEHHWSLSLSLSL